MSISECLVMLGRRYVLVVVRSRDEVPYKMPNGARRSSLDKRNVIWLSMRTSTLRQKCGRSRSIVAAR